MMMSVQRERVKMEPKTGRLAEVRERYCIGASTARKLASAANAVIRFGNTTLYDFERMDKYLSGLAGGANADQGK